MHLPGCVRNIWSGRWVKTTPIASSQISLFDTSKSSPNVKFNINNLKMKWFWEVFNRQKWEKEKSPAIYVWFSVCSQKHIMMIKDSFFISGLQINLLGMMPTFFYIPYGWRLPLLLQTKIPEKKYCPRWWPLVNLGSGPGFSSSNPMIPYQILRNKNWGPRYYPPYVNFVKYWPYLWT